jgi:hypothetical protein
LPVDRHVGVLAAEDDHLVASALAIGRRFDAPPIALGVDDADWLVVVEQVLDDQAQFGGLARARFAEKHRALIQHGNREWEFAHFRPFKPPLYRALVRFWTSSRVT